MEKTKVNPRLRDIVPFYGGFDYIDRTTFQVDERPSIKDYFIRGVISLTLLTYNGIIGAEILSKLEGKPSPTLNILEKIFQ